MSRKHVPQRTCIGCRRVLAKRELLRIVRTPEGRVLPDPKGKLNGRGTYVHKQRECFDEVLRQPGRLASALKLEKPIPEEDWRLLLDLAATFPARKAEEAPGNGSQIAALASNRDASS